MRDDQARQGSTMRRGGLRRPAVLALLLVCGTGCGTDPAGAGRPSALNPTGEYATIETGPSQSAKRAIANGDPEAVRRVMERPGDFNPPTLVLAAYALHREQPAQAMYFFYLGQLRARSDVNKSLEPSTEAAMSVINESVGPHINRYAFNDTGRLKAVIRRVIADDQTLPRNYDPRWVALHGLGAFTRETIPFYPEERWEAINARTREAWLEQFRQVLDKVERLRTRNTDQTRSEN